MTLATLDAALYAALAVAQHAGTATDAAPFALVGRYAGDLSEDGLTEACAQYPAALLRWDGGAASRTVDAIEGVEDMGVEAWTVFVALEDVRSIDDAVASTTTGAPGGLSLIDRVLSACNGLVTDDLWRDRRVRASAYGAALIKRGIVYVYSVRFEARRALPQLPLTTAQSGTAQMLTAIAADVDLVDPTPGDANPMTRLLVEY